MLPDRLIIRQLIRGYPVAVGTEHLETLTGMSFYSKEAQRTLIVDAFERAWQVGAAGIDIAYQRLGPLEAPPVLLIMGIAAQAIHWPEAFCQALVNHGLQVIRFDNRDSGLSTHLADVPTPNLPAVLAGDRSSVSYTLSDMAQDTVGLLDHLGIGQAHLVGASMGARSRKPWRSNIQTGSGLSPR